MEYWYGGFHGVFHNIPPYSAIFHNIPRYFTYHIWLANQRQGNQLNTLSPIFNGIFLGSSKGVSIISYGFNNLNNARIYGDPSTHLKIWTFAMRNPLVLKQINIFGINGFLNPNSYFDLTHPNPNIFRIFYSPVAIGVKNLWAMKVSGPKKAMHFRKVHYAYSFSGPLHFHRKSLKVGEGL